MKQWPNTLLQYVPWLLLLFGADAFAALLLWIADVQAFYSLASVILLATLLFFSAVCSSLFGVWSLLTGILPSSARNGRSEMLLISAAMILVLSVIESIYIMAVKRASDRYLLTLMVPMREE